MQMLFHRILRDNLFKFYFGGVILTPKY